jgi:hypothetical protein
MKTLIIASMRKNAGKTSIIAGLGKNIKGKTGYIKPFGDKIFYKKKRLWDYDSAVISSILGLRENPEDMSIGFDHSKIEYSYNEKSIENRVIELVSKMGKDKDVLFIECGDDISYGLSVNLDAVSISRYTRGKLFIIVSGDDDTIMDDITFINKNINLSKMNFAGVIINKVKNPEDFRNTYSKKIKKMGINVLGIIPFHKQLTYLSLDYLSNRLFAKVLTGEKYLNRTIRNVCIYAMSSHDDLKKQAFKRKDKLVITGGDRSDMIITALDTNSAAIVLTGNIVPPSNIISRASEKKIPLLLVPFDTYETARQIESMEPRLTRDNTALTEMLQNICKKHLNVRKFQ